MKSKKGKVSKTAHIPKLLTETLIFLILDLLIHLSSLSFSNKLIQGNLFAWDNFSQLSINDTFQVPALERSRCVLTLPTSFAATTKILFGNPVNVNVHVLNNTRQHCKAFICPDT